MASLMRYAGLSGARSTSFAYVLVGVRVVGDGHADLALHQQVLDLPCCWWRSPTLPGAGAAGGDEDGRRGGTLLGDGRRRGRGRGPAAAGSAASTGGVLRSGRSDRRRCRGRSRRAAAGRRRRSRRGSRLARETQHRGRPAQHDLDVGLQLRVVTRRVEQRVVVLHLLFERLAQLVARGRARHPQPGLAVETRRALQLLLHLQPDGLARGRIGALAQRREQERARLHLHHGLRAPPTASWRTPEASSA